MSILSAASWKSENCLPSNSYKIHSLCCNLSLVIQQRRIWTGNSTQIRDVAVIPSNVFRAQSSPRQIDTGAVCVRNYFQLLRVPGGDAKQVSRHGWTKRKFRLLTPGPPWRRNLYFEQTWIRNILLPKATLFLKRHSSHPRKCATVFCSWDCPFSAIYRSVLPIAGDVFKYCGASQPGVWYSHVPLLYITQVVPKWLRQSAQLHILVLWSHTLGNLTSEKNSELQKSRGCHRD